MAQASLFARLIPINLPAIQGIDSVIRDLASRPANQQPHHAKFIRASKARPLRDILPNIPAIDRSVTNLGATTLNRETFYGYFEFNVAIQPKVPDLGWVVGPGLVVDRGGNSGVDIALAMPQAQQIPVQLQQLHDRHAAFNFNSRKKFQVTVLQDGAAIRMDRSDSSNAGEARLLVRPEMYLEIAGLLYAFRWQVTDNGQWQERLDTYAEIYLNLPRHPQSRSATPLSSQTVIGPWRVLRPIKLTAPDEIYRIGTSARGEMVTIISRIRENQNNSFDPLLAHYRALDNDLNNVNGNFLVMKFRDVVYSGSQPVYNDIDDAHIVLSPAPDEGTFERLVPQARELDLASKKRHLFAQAARALAALHAAKWVHRDIQPATLGITENLDAVLMEFGTAVRLEARNDYKLPCTPGPRGTVGYQAPEIEGAPNTTYAFKADVFSLGCIGFELFVMEMPWRKRSNPWGADVSLADQEESRRQLEHELKWLAKSKTHEISSILSDMLAFDPAKRITAAQACTRLYHRDLAAA